MPRHDQIDRQEQPRWQHQRHKYDLWIVMGALLLIATFSANSPISVQLAEAQSLNQDERELYIQGVLERARKLFDRGDFEACIPLLEEVRDYREHSAVYQRLAIAYERVGKPAQAVKAYQRILQLQPDLPRRGRIEHEIARLSSLTRTTLKVNTDPSGFQVYLNNREGEYLGETPLTLTREQGTLVIYVTREDYRPETKVLTLTGGQEHLITLSPLRLAAGIKVSSTPHGAMVKLVAEDNRELFLGETPLVRRRLLPGAYKLQVTSPDHEPYAERLILEGGEFSEHDVMLSPIPAQEEEVSEASPWSIGLIAGGGATLLTSAVLWLRTSDAIEEINTYDTRDPTHTRAELRQMEAEVPPLKAATWLTAGVGAATLSTGLLMLWFDDTEHAPGSPTTKHTDAEGKLSVVPTGDAGGLIFWRGHY